MGGVSTTILMVLTRSGSHTISAQDLVWTSTAIVAIGTALGMLYRFIVRPVMSVTGRANDFLDDWFGTPGRDGTPARKGVMHRLSEIEVGKADRAELADLVSLIAQKADREEVIAIRTLLDEYLDSIHYDRG